MPVIVGRGSGRSPSALHSVRGLVGRAAQAFRYCGMGATGNQHLPYGEIVTSAEITVDGYRIDPLTPPTWPAFAALAERHNGVFGGCWCVWFHCHPDPPERQEMGNRAFKQRMIEEGRAHAALVFDGDEAIAWAEYGTVDELPNIRHRKEWEQTVEQVPDFRITCDEWRSAGPGRSDRGLLRRGERAGLASIRRAPSSRSRVDGVRRFGGQDRCWTIRLRRSDEARVRGGGDPVSLHPGPRR